MKKLIRTFAVVVLAVSLHAQGLLTFSNIVSTDVYGGTYIELEGDNQPGDNPLADFNFTTGQSVTVDFGSLLPAGDGYGQLNNVVGIGDANAEYGFTIDWNGLNPADNYVIPFSQNSDGNITSPDLGNGGLLSPQVVPEPSTNAFFLLLATTLLLWSLHTKNRFSTLRLGRLEQSECLRLSLGLSGPSVASKEHLTHQ